MFPLGKMLSAAPLTLLCVSTIALGGCGAARASTPTRTPDHWSKDGYLWPVGAGDETSSLQKSVMRSSAEPVHTESFAKQSYSEPYEGEPSEAEKSALLRPQTTTPEPTFAPTQVGTACLDTLRHEGVSFVPLNELRGVENPVEIRGAIGGVTFYANDGRPFQMDCRLAVALHQLAPLFKKYQVVRARYSGAYAYRQTKSGRLSHHALGLAIDVHEVTLGRDTFSVEKDFARGKGCPGSMGQLNRLACDLQNSRIFDEFLTPDFNADHRDHLHISVPRRSFSGPGQRKTAS